MKTETKTATKSLRNCRFIIGQTYLIQWEGADAPHPVHYQFEGWVNGSARFYQPGFGSNFHDGLRRVVSVERTYSYEPVAFEFDRNSDETLRASWVGMDAWIATYGGAEVPRADAGDVDWKTWVGDWTDGTFTWRLTAIGGTITAEEV